MNHQGGTSSFARVKFCISPGSGRFPCPFLPRRKASQRGSDTHSGSHSLEIWVPLVVRSNHLSNEAASSSIHPQEVTYLSLRQVSFTEGFFQNSHDVPKSLSSPDIPLHFLMPAPSRLFLSDWSFSGLSLTQVPLRLQITPSWPELFLFLFYSLIYNIATTVSPTSLPAPGPDSHPLFFSKKVPSDTNQTAYQIAVRLCTSPSIKAGQDNSV